MRVPVPSIDPLPDAVEIQARAAHAKALRDADPHITDRAILLDWDLLDGATRDGLLAEAQARIEERAARPACPDDVEALLAKLEPHHRAARERTEVEASAPGCVDCE